MTRPDVERLEAMLNAPRDAQAELGAAFGAAQQLDADGIAALQRELDAALRREDPERLAPMALLAGAIVETGGDPADLPPTIYDRLAAWFAAVPDAAPDSTDHELLPEAFYVYEQAAMAALSRSRELRRDLPQKAAIQASIRHYEQRYGFLNRMLSVMDNEPLVVLHPSTDRGWICRIDGVADNFQLHTLLLGALAGRSEDQVGGERPSDAAIAATSSGDPAPNEVVRSAWQLANWTGVRQDRSIGDDRRDRDWIWNEGYPAEIAAYEGARVVALGQSTYTRSWGAGRIFQALHASLVVEGRLTGAREVIDDIAERAASST